MTPETYPVVLIEQEMQQAYLDYAMSVIVARALPDARDGLKPVQRRILYAMYDMGLRPDSAFKKSARIVGEVLGKYHPHGDMAVYDAMARMAQSFSMRYPLVDGQGNFGSVDGDPPAAMRYTEARLTSAALELLREIPKGTVDFLANFDDSLQEPVVLPASLPNLLVNGATGIAVGMSTSIPPHNLAEVIDALIYMLERWERLDEVAIGDLMKFIQGPDFPTGGLLLDDGASGLEQAYAAGRGKVTMQARVHVEEMERGKRRLVVTELPYMVNKASLISRIADLVRNGKLDGITDLRDESDRRGMRIVIELNKNTRPEAVLQQLYKRTPLRQTLSMILLALVDGEPRMLTLKQALKVYLDHRIEVVRRRTQFDLDKAEKRAHIIAGLLIALDNLDEVIATIRRAPDADTARKRLMRKFKLTETQATAILDMQLRRLAALERKKLKQEYAELKKTIRALRTLLKYPKKMRALIAEELLAVKETYGDRRRTQVIRLEEGVDKSEVLTADQAIADREVWVTVDAAGRLARIPAERTLRRSGSEAPQRLARARTTDTLYLVTEGGKAAALPVHTLPEAEKPSQGTPWSAITPLKQAEALAAIFTLPADRGPLQGDHYLLTVTRGGMVKKSPLTDVPGPSAQPFRLARVNDGDQLGWVLLTDGKQHIALVSNAGMGIRFAEKDVRPMGLAAAGVNGMKLGVGEFVVGAVLAPDDAALLLVADDGYGKRLPAREFPVQGRYGKGVQAWKRTGQRQLVGVVTGKNTLRVTAHLKKRAAKMARLDAAPLSKRSAARGARVFEVGADDRVLFLTTPWDWESFVRMFRK